MILKQRAPNRLVSYHFTLSFQTHMSTSVKFIVTAWIVFFFVPSVLSAQDSNKTVSYSEFGAVGDGKTDDFDAIIKAHAAANESGQKVRADAGATYYIGGAAKTAQIQTDTDWGNAKFIIDDSKVEARNRNSSLFNVSSKLPSARITTVKTLKKNQEKIDVSFPHDSFIAVTDNSTKRYIRYGANRNDGAAQTDVFVVDKNGNVDMKAPIIWDYDNITAMTAYPVDAETLTISGGHFTTLANQTNAASYYARGIAVMRSNTVIDGMEHAIVEEPEYHAPYGGFISISNCTGATVQNCKLSGHMTAYTTTRGDTPWSTGTYDVTVTRATNITFRNCKQINDIHDTKRWGIFGSNYSKNITFDTVEFSRFDAHMGVANATIKNSVLGHQGINLIGCGTFLVENTKVCGSNFINLRSDYGSTFEGEIIIRNCEYLPRNGTRADATLIGGSYSGQHNFGYTCYMPRKITIDGLIINDNNPPNNYRGPKIFADFNSANKNEEYVEKYPYIITEEIEIRNLTIKSGKPYSISNNPFMFRNVRCLVH